MRNSSLATLGAITAMVTSGLGDYRNPYRSRAYHVDRSYGRSHEEHERVEAAKRKEKNKKKAAEKNRRKNR